jgi:hypothetical protein
MTGYFEHRRRHTEDSLIVSHIASLILKYDCHINVEFSSGVHLFQYFFKYFFKPLDHANWTVSIEQPALQNIPRSLGGKKMLMKFVTMREVDISPVLKLQHDLHPSISLKNTLV